MKSVSYETGGKQAYRLRWKNSPYRKPLILKGVRQVGKTLVIFDEVQDCPKVINSLKYFCENAPQYRIACAGSLLGIALAKPSSFPVGKVNFLQIDPMTFTELFEVGWQCTEHPAIYGGSNRSFDRAGITAVRKRVPRTTERQLSLIHISEPTRRS